MSHWRKEWTKASLKPSDEVFWHATTFANVKRIHGSQEGIRPELGDGANGKGFYVCPRRTDYQKVMAFRNRQEGDRKELFILKVLVEDFYGMKPLFSNGLAGVILDTECDFVGSRWNTDIVGDSRNSKPGRKDEMGGEKSTLGAYDAYRGEPITTPGYNKDKAALEYRGGSKVTGWKAKDARRSQALERLWNAAQANRRPDEGTGSKKLDLLMDTLGPRKAFLATLEEITFKKQTGPKIAIVGARKFYAESPGDRLVDWFDEDAKVALADVEALLA